MRNLNYSDDQSWLLNQPGHSPDFLCLGPQGHIAEYSPYFAAVRWNDL